MAGEDEEERGGGRTGPWIASGSCAGLVLAGAALLGEASWTLAGLLAVAAPLAAWISTRGGGAPRRRLPGRPRPERPVTAHTLLATIPDPVILVDRRVVVLDANSAATALLPVLKVSHPLSFALRSPDVLDGIAQALSTGLPQRVEYAERVPTERIHEVQIGAVEGEPGEAARAAVLVFRDLTPARRLEHMRVDFVANASHELRTPLASLLGFIETLQGPARNDAGARERFLEIMRVQARRMTRLIDDLLSLSRIELREHVAPEGVVDLATIVREMTETLAPMAREAALAVDLSIDDGPHRVKGDRDELLRVVENLVENAIKYGEGGERIEVTLTRSGHAETAAVELGVRDHGPGIAAEHLPRLTERFYRADAAQSRQKGGTGLGLAIVKHILTRHRGRLTIESRPGEGALFRVSLPAAT